MNILPKKSWHVRNKDNIERVRRDEAKAAEEEKERQRKIALAESEARLDKLRESSRKRQRNDDTHYEEEGQIVKFVKPEHVNFFKDEEAGLSKGQLGNTEHEKEKKEEKEKWEKKIGLLTYLGQGSVESQTSKPWYHKQREKTAKVEEEDKKTSKHNEEQDRKTKSSLDPMQQMSKYLTILEKQKERKEEKEGHSKKHKKHKHKHKSKEREKEKSSGGEKTMEQLRAERLQREREEKARTEELLARRRGEKLPGDKQAITDERQMGYNSVFHPELSRKPKRKDYY